LYLIKEVELCVFIWLYQNCQIYSYLGTENFLHYFSSLWFPCSCNRLDLKCLPLDITFPCSSLEMKGEANLILHQWCVNDTTNFYGVKDLLHTAAEASFPSCASWIPRLWCMPMKWEAGVGLLVDTACQLWAGLCMLCLVNLKPWNQNSERERVNYVLKKNPNYLSIVEFCPVIVVKIMHISQKIQEWSSFPTTKI
jgi:hypothetical protein